MAITGTGTELDPFVVETYAELVEKAAANSEVFIKIGNDINITDEFPHGDMPQLAITHARIDGDGKTITNWYNLQDRYAIKIEGATGTSGRNPQIKNLNFYNILQLGNEEFIFLKYGTYDGIYMLKDCEFSGECYNGFVEGYSSDTYDRDHFMKCSINIDCHSQCFSSNAVTFDSCRIIAKTAYNTVFWTQREHKIRNSYLTITMTGSQQTQSLLSDQRAQSNNIYDVYTDAVFQNIGAESTEYPISIISLEHAPNAVAYAGNVATVPTAHWYDVDYLQDIGFLCTVSPLSGGNS